MFAFTLTVLSTPQGGVGAPGAARREPHPT